MGRARAILKRRKAVMNIRKITRTMQLIATARFQRAFQRVTASKPYAEQIQAMVAKLSAAGTIEHPLLRPCCDTNDLDLLVITGNRGLCGSYNTALLAKAMDFLREQAEQGLKVNLSVAGKKGQAYMRFTGQPMAVEYHVADEPAYQQVEQIAQHYMDRFVAGQTRQVCVVYCRFYSSSRQSPEVLKLLPISCVAGFDEDESADRRPTTEYEFSPQASQLLAELLPEAVKTTLFQCFTEAAACEQVARMVAMKAASDNSEEMIKQLSRQANKARQAQITSELSELLAGSEALS